VLAEVSDKIPPAAFVYCFHLVAAAAMLVLAVLSQRRAVLVVLLPLMIAWAALFAHDALFADDPLRDEVVQEMGATYYVHQVVAALMPAGAVVGGVMIERRRKNTGASPSRQLALAVGAAVLVLMALLVYMIVGPSAPFAGILD
jgi:hypothetical protein